MSHIAIMLSLFFTVSLFCSVYTKITTSSMRPCIKDHNKIVLILAELYFYGTIAEVLLIFNIQSRSRRS